MSQGSKFWLWVRRLLLYPLAVGFSIVLAVLIAMLAPDCKISRVVLGSGADPDSHIILAVENSYYDDKPKFRKILWDGPLGLSCPVLIPFDFFYPGDGTLTIEVKYPGNPVPIVLRDGYVTGDGTTHYFFVGKKEIIYEVTNGGLFANQKEIAIFGLPTWLLLLGTYRLSCMDGS